MTMRVTETEFNLLRNLIKERIGISLGDEKQYLIENRLTRLAGETDCNNFGEFYVRIKNCQPSARLWSAVVDAITTNETSWLRDQHPFVILSERLFPQFYREIREGKRKSVNIWSAACSTGQEPYSIAMKALEFYRTAGGEKACREQVQILATDISSEALSVAMAGKYDRFSTLRGLPEESVPRFFQKRDDFWFVNECVKQIVAFKKINLQEPLFGFGKFDVVFLRNVIIYFSDSFKQDLLNRIARVLNPGGYLFLGTGESATGYTSVFDVVEHGGALFYQVKT